MASFITAGNATNGLQVSSDNTGILELKSGTGSGTTAVTVDTSQNAIFAGNVGIGTSSPTTKLHLAAAGDVGGKAVNSATTGSATLNVTNNSGSIGQLMIYGSAQGAYGALGSGEVALYCTTSTTLMVDNVSGVLKFTAGGNAERARITSGGNLLVGSTTDDARLRVNGTAVVGRFVADGGGYANDVVLIDTSGTAAGTGFDLIQANSGGAVQFRVRGDGTIFAQNTTVQSASDFRIKENIRDSEEGLAVVTALRPVRFDFKEGFGNDKKNQLGFIAQEMEQVFPDAVDVAAKEETDDEDAEPYKTVGAAALIPVLVKAIQEQQAMIDEMKAEIAALKGAA